MIETRKLQTYVGSDGILKLELPIGVQDVDCDVVIVYAVQPKTDTAEDWPSFVERMYGALADDPIERPAQLPLETRDEIE